MKDSFHAYCQGASTPGRAPFSKVERFCRNRSCNRGYPVFVKHNHRDQRDSENKEHVISLLVTGVSATSTVIRRRPKLYDYFAQHARRWSAPDFGLREDATYEINKILHDLPPGPYFVRSHELKRRYSGVCLLHSYANRFTNGGGQCREKFVPLRFERRAAEIKEYERTVTTVMPTFFPPASGT
jgi:hypothetical protein